MRRPLLAAGRAVVLGALVGLVACDAAGLASPTRVPATTGAGSPGAPTAPPLTPVPTAPAPSASQAIASRMATEWGPIWDALPLDFPTSTVSSLTPVEPDEVASGAFEASGSVADVSAAIQAILERGSFSTESMSGPFEDGSVVIESVGGASTDCRVHTTVARLGGLTRVTILYGAACPFG